VGSRNYHAIAFRRLSEVNPRDIINLMSDPVVRRHLPLARGGFGESECAQFLAAKERMWEETGYGPWAFVLGDEFVGWGGLQPEGDDVDVGMILHPDYWGAGRVLFARIIDYAFGELGVASVIALLPPSRTRVAGLRRLGFRPDGDTLLGGERFLRYRLDAPGPADLDT
jgi:[ribosomal protein S5]-alanine N-acetyltransferase